MTQVFGPYVEPDDQNREYLQINFSPTSLPLQQRWRTNGLSADFLAGYLETFFPGDDAATLNRRTDVRDAVGFIANELLENAMKFTYAPAHHAVSITLQLARDQVLFYVSNHIDPDPPAIAAFQSFIRQLLTQDPVELYRQQVLSRADDATHTSSGLGYLTMLNDYGARLAWQFEIADPAADIRAPSVTTMVQLPL
jgi:hypothetical protein